MKKLKRTIFILIAVVMVFGTTAAFAKSSNFPKTIPIPNGFQPEGIVGGYGSDFYVGSIPTGAIYQGDFRTGEGEILVEGSEGGSAIGLSFDERTGYLFVSGGGTGSASVYDTATGDLAGFVQLTDASPTFINDVVVTPDAAYFTDSSQPVLYRVPLNADGSLPDPLTAEEVPLGGEFEFVPGAFNANGIDATPSGDTLIIVSSTLGALFTVDPDSGEAAQIDLGDGAVPNGDGILLDGNRLYVVQNFLNQVAVIKLYPDLDRGVIGATISDPDFRIPTTIAEFGSRLYVVNARFDTTPTPDTEYEVVRISKGPGPEPYPEPYPYP